MIKAATLTIKIISKPVLVSVPPLAEPLPVPDTVPVVVVPAPAFELDDELLLDDDPYTELL
jgi:hypothetical protein